MSSLVQRLHHDLPVFALSQGTAAVLYAPGHACAVPLADVTQWAEKFRQVRTSSSPVVADLMRYAAQAESAWESLRTRAFAPECLTVYLSNHCQLGCVYCFAAGEAGRRDMGWEGKPLPLVPLGAVEAAARLVAANCARTGKPFHLVLHGGGEPTLHWELLIEVVETARRVAMEFGLSVWSYISTSGVLSEAKAHWLAGNIQQVSLSVDGPPEIHDAQRPLRSGTPTFVTVQRTARILREAGANFAVRSTITKKSVTRQAEILAELHTRLGAREFTFEPAYRPSSEDDWGFATKEDASLFVDHFLAAQNVAEVLGCTLQTSGVRLDEIHGPYCNILRQVLQLVPDGTAVSCFTCTDGTQPAYAAQRIGAWNESDGTFVLDESRIAQLREAATVIPERCQTCVNIHHCARDCPDVCPVPAARDKDAEGGFRCQVQRFLGEAWILNALKDAPKSVLLEPGELGAVLNTLRRVPDLVSAASVTSLWSRSRHRGLSPRRAPDPPWVNRGFDLDGPAAWNALSGSIAEAMPHAPMSVYLHVPFCDRKCAFCDCYTTLEKEPDSSGRMDSYVRALLHEMETWSRLPNLPQRPVTTIHFGGGTPTLLRTTQMREIVTTLRKLFHVHESTELAVESTTQQISAEHLETLQEMGFSRLHIGVQTLHDPARKLSGRQESVAQVKGKLRAALDLGWIVTVDVIYGLPGQTTQHFLDTLAQLDAMGVHGFSLYKLNLTTHNRPFAETHNLAQRSHPELFFSFLLGEAFLLSRGYRKTHFAHYSKPADRYLYYTHVRRGEDLLALGPSADGSFGPLHYRHSELGACLGAVNSGGVALAGASIETAEENLLRAATAALMTASVPGAVFKNLQAGELLEHWTAEELLAHDDTASDLSLTGTGSWYLADMFAEISDLVSSHGNSTKPGAGRS